MLGLFFLQLQPVMADFNFNYTGEFGPLNRRFWNSCAQLQCWSLFCYRYYYFLNTSLSFSLCFSLQLKQPDKAAAAAHTYFQANPEHVEMGQNLEQYKDLQGVKEDHFVDREARPHQVSQEIGWTFGLFLTLLSFVLFCFRCSFFVPFDASAWACFRWSVSPVAF